jgi:hypothetical protein
MLTTCTVRAATLAAGLPDINLSLCTLHAQAEAAHAKVEALQQHMAELERLGRAQEHPEPEVATGCRTQGHTYCLGFTHSHWPCTWVCCGSWQLSTRNRLCSRGLAMQCTAIIAALTFEQL